MTSVESRPVFRQQIAGLPIAALAQQFGTPTYVYDEQTIQQRIADLRQFDVIRYAQKACSNLAILDLMRRAGVLVDAVSAGEIRTRPAGRLFPGRRSSADRLHGGYLRSGRVATVCRPRYSCQCWIAGHDRSVRSSGPRTFVNAASESRVWARAFSKDEHRGTAIQARHLAQPNRGVHFARRPLRFDGHGSAHAHRIRDRPAASLADLRCDGSGGGRRRTHGGNGQYWWRTADSVPPGRRLRGSRRVLSFVG